MAVCCMERILQPVRSSKIAAQSTRNARMHVLCEAVGAKKQLKAARKSLEAKQKEVQQITESLRTGASFTSPHRLTAVIESLQRLGAEVEEIACLADNAPDSSSSSSSSESDCDSESTVALRESPELVSDPETATEAKESKVSSSGNDADCVEQSYRLDHSRSDATLSETAPAIALLEKAALTTGMPAEHGKLWQMATDVLGGKAVGRMSICQGKACVRAGGKEVLEAFKDIATNQPGLHVEACKCLDKCKQGPNIRVEHPDGVGEVLTSSSKPVKKDKRALLVST